jgi:hypothetical protein
MPNDRFSCIWAHVGLRRLLGPPADPRRTALSQVVENYSARRAPLNIPASRQP